MDKSLLIGGLLLGLTILGGLFHFLRLGLYSMGIDRTPAGIVSGILLGVGAIFIYRTIF